MPNRPINFLNLYAVGFVVLLYGPLLLIVLFARRIGYLRLPRWVPAA